MAGKSRTRQFGSIRKLPSGRWQAHYFGPDGKRRPAPVTFATKTDASTWLSTVETDVIRGEWRPPEPARETLGAYGKRWLAHRPDLRPSTAELYGILWKKWLEPELGTVPLGKLTTEAVRVWFTEATAAHEGSTQPAKAYRLLRAMLNTAVDDGLVRANPCRVKGAGSERAGERPTATVAQVYAVADAIGEHDRCMVLLAAFCSVRFGELAGLRRRRVDLLHRTITIEEQAVELAGGRVVFGPPKTDAGRRTVAIPEPLVVDLEEHLSAHVGPDPEALVFTSPQGHPLRRTKWRQRWLDACSAAGVTELHFHDLRHTGATLAAAEGATVRELMARLGHTTPTVALRYQHATADRERAIADALGGLITRALDAEPEPAAEVVSLSRK